MKSWKKQISVYKFQRIATNPNSVRVKGLFSKNIYIPELTQAFEAYELDGFLYMWRPSGKITGDRLTSYFVRYKLGSRKTNDEWVVTGGRV